jgi:hypothetical protein
MEPLFPAGSDGVDIFFVISSFIWPIRYPGQIARSAFGQSIMDLAPHRRSSEAADTIKTVCPTICKKIHFEILHNGLRVLTLG